jgi:hypothetical protein
MKAVGVTLYYDMMHRKGTAYSPFLSTSYDHTSLSLSEVEVRTWDNHLVATSGQDLHPMLVGAALCEVVVVWTWIRVEFVSSEDRIDVAGTRVRSFFFWEDLTY